MDKFNSVDDVKHMLEGEVDKGVAKGFHFEGQGTNRIPGSKGEVIGNPTKPADTSLPSWSQIYEARVKVDGVTKPVVSTFFPKAMTPQAIITEVNRALKNGKLIEPGIIEGVSKYGFKIKMYLNGAGKVTNAHPIMPYGVYMKYDHSWRQIDFEDAPPTLIMVLPDAVSAVASFLRTEISHGDIAFYTSHFYKILTGEQVNEGQPGNEFVVDVYPDKMVIHSVYRDYAKAEIETEEMFRLMKIWSEAHRMFYKEKVPIEQLP